MSALIFAYPSIIVDVLDLQQENKSVNTKVIQYAV